MQLSISLAGCFKQLGRHRQPAPNNKPVRDKETYIDYMTKSLLDNNRTIIDWHSENGENKDCQATNGNNFYDKLVNRFLCNFSTFRSND